MRTNPTPDKPKNIPGFFLNALAEWDITFAECFRSFILLYESTARPRAKSSAKIVITPSVNTAVISKINILAPSVAKMIPRGILCRRTSQSMERDATQKTDPTIISGASKKTSNIPSSPSILLLLDDERKRLSWSS
eukprot:4218492-Ditylum_brightwellii.AAC.1